MLARILTIVVALVLLGSLATRYRRGRISLRKALFWAGPWVGVVIVMLSPRLADAVAAALGLEDANGIDLVVYLGVAFAYFLLHRLVLRLDRIEHSLTRLVRHQAMSDAAAGAPRAAAESEPDR